MKAFDPNDEWLTSIICYAKNFRGENVQEGKFHSGNTMNKNQSSNPVWILLSGGIDSTACLEFYLEQGHSVQCIFINYGQISAKHEAKSARNIAEYYKVFLTQFKWSGHLKKNAGLIFGRNAFLLLAALMEMPMNSGILAIGIHSGTSYYDCSSAFLTKIQTIFDSYTKGMIQIDTPFLKWTKRDVWSFCMSRNVPVNLTYSCELGLEQPCGRCLSCSDLEVMYAST